MKISGPVIGQNSKLSQIQLVLRAIGEISLEKVGVAPAGYLNLEFDRLSGQSALLSDRGYVQ